MAWKRAECPSDHPQASIDQEAIDPAALAFERPHDGQHGRQR